MLKGFVEHFISWEANTGNDLLEIGSEIHNGGSPGLWK